MKRMLFEFVGGDMDGRTIDSETTDPQEQMHVNVLLSMTNNGTVGHGFNGLSMSSVEALQTGEKTVRDFTPAHARHWYTVVSRNEDDDKVVVRIKHEIRE